MLTWLKQLLYDPAAFFAALNNGTAKLRGLLMLLGVALASGAVSLDSLSETLGPLGWWIGWGAIALGGFVAHGDKTPPELKLIAEQLRVTNKPAVLDDNPPVPADIVAQAEKKEG